MMKEIDPKLTPRAMAFDLWMDAPMPMVTLIKIMDVSRLVKLRKRHGFKFNMLMCWCIGKAATQTEEFFLLPVDKKLFKYDKLAVNTIVALDADAKKINSCDVPLPEHFNRDGFQEFNKNYLRLTQQVRNTGEAHDLSEQCMIIGTSAIAQCEIDGAINIYDGRFNNPFLIWGKYKRKFFRTTLSLSFQFHHAQMDGMAAARFLERLQHEIKNFRVRD